MNDGLIEAVLTEPVVVQCIFVEGIDVEIGDTFLRIVGWIHLSTVHYEQPERRIVARAVMPISVARDLVKTMRKKLMKGGN